MGVYLPCSSSSMQSLRLAMPSSLSAGHSSCKKPFSLWWPFSNLSFARLSITCILASYLIICIGSASVCASSYINAEAATVQETRTQSLRQESLGQSLRQESVAYRMLTSFYTVLAVACISLVWVIRYVSGSDVTGGRVGLLFHFVPSVSEIRGSWAAVCLQCLISHALHSSLWCIIECCLALFSLWVTQDVL